MIERLTFPTGSFACNCTFLYSSKTKEAIIVDPGNDKEIILTKVKQLGIEVKYLIHTHAHFDHIGASNEIAKALGAPIVLHKEDQNLYEHLQSQGIFFGIHLAPPGNIDIYLEDEQTFGFCDEGLNAFLKTIFTPGHTQGSCCFYLEEKNHPVLISGDTLFKQSIGRTDLPGGDMNKIIKSIKERLYKLPEETLVIPGHGPMTRIFDEKKSNPFVIG